MRYNWMNPEEPEMDDMTDTKVKQIGEEKGNKRANTKEADTDAEVALLELYLEELKAVPPVGELRKKELMQEASNGKQEARKKLVEIYLMQAVQLAAAYRGRGVGLADLIQEANVGLMEAMLADTITEKSILESMEAALIQALAEEGREVEVGEQIAARLNMLSDAAMELAERYGREATMEELAEYLSLTVDEVQRGMRVSLDAIGGGD